MTPAQNAIALINHHRMLMPKEEFSALATIISCAAVCNDRDAINYIWLLNWVPQQKVN